MSGSATHSNMPNKEMSRKDLLCGKGMPREDVK
jgi:hypothetical protein